MHSYNNSPSIFEIKSVFLSRTLVESGLGCHNVDNVYVHANVGLIVTPN